MTYLQEAIKSRLDMMAEQDPAFAERYKLENKSIEECCNYITSEAKKQAQKGCAVIEDAVVYGWAVHYYQEDNVVVDKTAKAKVVAPKAEKPKQEKKTTIKPIKALVKDKKNTGKCVELDLFGGF